MKTLVLPPGYRVELVAKEPLVIDPIAIDFDADGRMWVLEMPGFMSEAGGANSREPINNVVVLEDLNGDGVMDKRTVFADKLVLPRALKVLDAGVLVGEPPNLWLMKDTNGDLEGRYEGPGQRHLRPRRRQHRAQRQQPVLGHRQHHLHVRARLAPALQERQVRDHADAARAASGARRWTMPGGSSATSTTRRCSSTSSRRRYYARNPNLVRTRGLYDPLISREASVIWPIRQTRGVNRGYRDQFFRPDDSSVTIQGVGTPVVYRGDRLPKELYGDAFITDSTTNLVHRYKLVDDGSGRMKAVDGYDKGEILASSDERFRPVNMLPAPDGTLYVVDMYRGIVQEQIYWTDFLRDYINARDLVKPVNLGRIWRIVHDTTKRDQPPALSKAPAATLVKTLSHPNGWWRDKAQQLLVERGDATMAPQLKQLAMQSADWRARLHALWTLDGLDAIARGRSAAGADRQVRGRARGRDPAVGALDHAAEPCARRRSCSSWWTIRAGRSGGSSRRPSASCRSRRGPMPP